jgi:motility quorum-sensing regulator/GCU-specific mRNA interferase toxin
MKKVASYDLEEIKDLLKKEESRIIRRRDRQEAVRLGYADDDAMVNRVLKLVSSEFYKTMPSDKTVLMQDVYYTYDGSIKIYIKLQVSLDGKGVVISFKEA